MGGVMRGQILTLVCLCAAGAAWADPNSVSNDIPPRLQWNANWGYCGEVSFISAGLYYGQYISQYDARALATPGVPQNLVNSQLLLDVNAKFAAAAMHLNVQTWNSASKKPSTTFLSWVKHYVGAGYPVVIGLFDNYYRFYNDKNPNAGSVAYDHIVPVFGISSDFKLPSRHYHPRDTISFNDNGEWWDGNHPQYVFTYKFDKFQLTRQQANSPTGPVYSIDSAGPDYGIAFLGVADTGHVTLPVRLATSVNYEKPSIKNGTSTRPKPMPLTLSITVSGLTPGVAYKLYRYNNAANVPDANFNALSGNAAQSWNINIGSGSTYTRTENIMSDEQAFYRAVPASAT
jgi:hypothetical protein